MNIKRNLMTNLPKVKRLVICRGIYCNMDRRADQLLKVAQPIVDSINDEDINNRVLISTANCLSMCGNGPNCIVQPGRKPFNRVTKETIETIIDENLKDTS